MEYVANGMSYYWSVNDVINLIFGVSSVLPTFPSGDLKNVFAITMSSTHALTNDNCPRLSSEQMYIDSL